MKKTFFLLLIIVLALPAKADEGMWLLPLIKEQKLDEMQALGLMLQDRDIYNDDSLSIKDAILIFGGGCTGSIVSPDGLVFTNHHCGYSQIQQHSSVEHDYLTDGFWAQTRSEELSNPGLKVTFIDKIEEVTDLVNEKLKALNDPEGMDFLSTGFLNNIAREKAGEDFLKENPWMQVEILPFFGGNRYYMFTKKIYSDVRLVGAPPSSIGKFGADTDNWEWPRHAGDFSIFRVYTDPEGNPADFNAENIPMKPKKWLKVSGQGVTENDFAMILGFPGRTNKYYTSWEVAERRDIDNTVRIEIRDLRQQIMLEAMLKDPVVRIQYSSKYASSTNGYKNAIGTNWAINKRDFEAVKKAEQDHLLTWAQQNNKPEYAAALQKIEQIINDRKALREASWVMNEALVNGMEFYRIPTNLNVVTEALAGKDQIQKADALTLLETAYRVYANKDYSRSLDVKISKVMLQEYMRRIPAENQPEAIRRISTMKGGVSQFIDDLFEKSIFGSDENFATFMKKPTAKKLTNDPMFNFTNALKTERNRLTQKLQQYDQAYYKAHRDYVKGRLEMEGETNLFPDANFSIRLSYGQVKGYTPRNAVDYKAQTTLEGVMEKEDQDNWEFVVSDKLKSLFASKDYGKYANADGEMPVCFSATTHTTGGNSGSPVLNGNGELIGLNFDRNWEGVGGDIQYLPDYQRSIIVDIRYVLFVIDKYAGAGYLLEEMGLQ